MRLGDSSGYASAAEYDSQALRLDVGKVFLAARQASNLKDGVQLPVPALCISGCGSVWESARLGRERSQVQILSSRSTDRRGSVIDFVVI